MDRMNTRRLERIDPEKLAKELTKQLGLVFNEDYHQIRAEIQPNHRGYIFTLKDAIGIEGTSCDINIHYEMMGKALGISDNYKSGELEEIMEKIGPEFGVVPFFKFDAQEVPEDIPLTGMGELARVSPELAYFLWLAENKGRICKRELSHGKGALIGFESNFDEEKKQYLPSQYPVIVVQPETHEAVKIAEKRFELYRRLRS